MNSVVYRDKCLGMMVDLYGWYKIVAKCMGFVVCLFACSSASRGVWVVKSVTNCCWLYHLKKNYHFKKKNWIKEKLICMEILKFSSVFSSQQQKDSSKLAKTRRAQHQCLFIHNNLRQNDTNIPIHLLPSSAVYFVFTFSISFASITTNETSHTHISSFGINSISTNGTTSRI